MISIRPLRSIPCLVLAAALTAAASPEPKTLESGFQLPPDSCKPHTWWHWMNGHVTKEAITRDLEDMKRIGLGGFTLWNTQEGTPTGPVKYGSEEWWSLLDHTMKEAERLGLDMGIFNGAGWSSTGAPFVTPDKAMQEVAWTETDAKGPGKVKLKLPVPKAALGIERDMKKDPVINRRYYMPRETVEGYFRDIAVFAVPSLPAGQSPWQLKDWRDKAGFGKPERRFQPDASTPPADQVIQANQLIDVTRFMNADGELDWDAPAGDWTILRIGYQPTGRSNHPASVGGRGLEIDKLSPEALDFYWEHFLDRVVKTAGSRVGRTFTTISLDSYEVGHQNWSKDFPKLFSDATGYDIRKYLPVITGRVVESGAFTERVLWDYRKVIGDGIAKNYFAHMAERAHAAGLVFANEPYGSFGNTSDPVAASSVDIPTCEFWAYDTKQKERPAEAKVVASTARLYGRNLVDAEAFTGSPERIFETYPGGIKSQGDYFMTLGVNRFCFHTWAHDPYGVPPGLGLGTYGSRFDNRNTWWPYAKPWHEYLGRCFYLLRQGETVSDVLYYAGDEAPMRSKVVLRHGILADLPKGIDYTIANPEIFRSLRSENGLLLTAKGAGFRMLVLPDVPWMSLADLTTIERLLSDGAVISGKRPQSPPGKPNPGDMEKFTALADRIWGDCDGKNVISNKCGKGLVYSGIPLGEVVKQHGIGQDCSFVRAHGGKPGPTLYPDTDIEFIHRRAGNDEIYFLSNQNDAETSITAKFRVTGKTPELWLPDRGSRHRLADAKTSGDHTEVPLRFGPGEAYFVVFRDPREASARDAAPWVTPSKMAADLSADWKVEFPGNPTIILHDLVSWSTLNEEPLKHHSGTAIYRKSFSLETVVDASRYQLDLGDVKVIASVSINGKDCGIAWKTPYQVDVTDSLKPGENTIEVKVANLWVNRILGDQLFTDDIAWTSETGSTAAGQGLAAIPDWVKNGTPRPNPRRSTFYAWKWPHLNVDKPLLPSGMLGPVKLLESPAR